MKYYTRDELERIGRAGAFYDGEKARYLSLFWLYLEREDKAFTPHALDGFWEAWISVWMSREFEDCDMFWDIGANVGYYSMFAAASRVPVIAFEPLPHLVEMIHKSADANNIAIDVMEVALSDEAGRIKINIPKDHSGAATILDHTGEDWWSIPVKTAVFDDEFNMYLMNYGEKKKHLVKIDAEGAEPKIWAGMKKFRENTLWTYILEWAPSRYENAGQFADELLQYRVTRVDYDGIEQPVTKDSLMAVGDFEMIVVRCN